MFQVFEIQTELGAAVLYTGYRFIQVTLDSQFPLFSNTRGLFFCNKRVPVESIEPCFLAALIYFI